VSRPEHQPTASIPARLREEPFPYREGLPPLTASVKRHGLDPWVYLKHVLTELPGRLPGTGLSDLLPDRWNRCPAGPVAVPG